MIPRGMIKVFRVGSRKCFTMVDAQRLAGEPGPNGALSASGAETRGSNIGKGQMKAADYVARA